MQNFLCRQNSKPYPGHLRAGKMHTHPIPRQLKLDGQNYRLITPRAVQRFWHFKSPEMKKSVFLSAWSICIKHKDVDIIYLPCLNWLSGIPVRHVMRCKTGLPKAVDYISKYCFFKMKEQLWSIRKAPMNSTGTARALWQPPLLLTTALSFLLSPICTPPASSSYFRNYSGKLHWCFTSWWHSCYRNQSVR